MYGLDNQFVSLTENGSLIIIWVKDRYDHKIFKKGRFWFFLKKKVTSDCKKTHLSSDSHTILISDEQSTKVTSDQFVNKF